ncbi:hypothetical protein [Ascidiimonas sp. W6]|uniref:hypothetical protein n=1 Tax=Ascidiimonas meishanensis TaxID=3128903 RepID=UPI0030EDFC8B
MNHYPEIEALKAYFKKFNIKIQKSDKIINDALFFINFSINQNTWQLLLDDEYLDFDPEKPLVNLFLTFSSLQLYLKSDDFLVWCNYLDLSASNIRWLDYYQSLSTIYKEIEQTIGKIDSCITPLDYQLRTGVVNALVSSNFK